jgi:aryl-alcohol dehydrogenase-like predicted oxidoreductase
MARLAIAWVLRRPEVCAAITGATKVERVEEAAAAADVGLDAEVLDGLERALR